MAELIPSLNTCLPRMTPGERRFARCIETLLEEDYLCWFDIPIGRQPRFPDFIVLHPSRGLLFIEVKDWKLDTLVSVTKSQCVLRTSQGEKTVAHPLEQARQYAYTVLRDLVGDPQLRDPDPRYRGRLCCPYGWGVVFTNITRDQMRGTGSLEDIYSVFPDHLIMYADQLRLDTDPEDFQGALWNMFHHRFGSALTLPQIDRIRWHLFPELRIEHAQADFFGLPGESVESTNPEVLPDIIRVLDVQQEKLARNLGPGHRVIHGVAGSGKTLVLGFRCLQLAQTSHKPILVLCFNITLAARLREFLLHKNVASQVSVYHFHDWCRQQLKSYHVETPASDEPPWDATVSAVIRAVDEGWIPRAQYGAVLIDEGNDFAPDWLRLIVQMVDPETNSLLLVYDDAQSVYDRGTSGGLGFSLASVGIQAKGRTTVLKVNYRNTREIIDFAYRFVVDYLQGEDLDNVEIIEPSAIGRSGPVPRCISTSSVQDEIAEIVAQVEAWRERGYAWRDMAVLYRAGSYGRLLHHAFTDREWPCAWLASADYKRSYSLDRDVLTITTLHSSKGLEFPAVAIAGAGVEPPDTSVRENATLLYVGMTRACEELTVTMSRENTLTAALRRWI